MRINYAGPILVELHEEILFLPGHVIHRWAKKLQTEDTRNIKNAAPVNKRTKKFPSAVAKDGGRGYLRDSMHGETSLVTPKLLAMDTISPASYFKFVLGGTRTQWRRVGGEKRPGVNRGQFTTTKRGFPLPTNNYGPFRRVQRIRGQAANNFVARGRAKTAARHESLRGTKVLQWF